MSTGSREEQLLRGGSSPYIPLPYFVYTHVILPDLCAPHDPLPLLLTMFHLMPALGATGILYGLSNAILHSPTY